jgi:hypothetical protein
MANIFVTLLTSSKQMEERRENATTARALQPYQLAPSLVSLQMAKASSRTTATHH